MKLKFIPKYLKLLLLPLFLLCGLDEGFSQCPDNSIKVTTTPATCFGASDGTITITVDKPNGYTGSYTYRIAKSPTFQTTNFITNATSHTFTGLSSGNYIPVVVDLSNGCVDFPNNPSFIFISQPNKISATPNIFINSDCTAPDGSITLNVTGGSGNYAYAWTSDNGYTATSKDITGLAGGNYTVTITDQSTTGCSETFGPYTVTDPSPAKNLPVSDPTICNPNISDVNIVITNSENGVKYELQTLAGASFNPPIKGIGNGTNLTLTIPQAPTTTTSYRVRAVDGLCTPAILDDRAVVTVNNLPVATFNYLDNPYCSNGTDPTPTFAGGGVAGTFSSSVGLVIDPATGTVDLSASTAGTYAVTNTIATTGGCPIVTATSLITITALPIATFSYANDPYCKTGTDPIPTLATGAVAGTFTSTTGLAINATTGLVDLSASTAGTYTVTNTVVAANGCPEVKATTNITINTPAVATFNYPDNPYCSNGTDPTPTFTGGGVAGTFTATPTGLVINATTGAVDLSASTAGTYAVTNTIAATGGCPIVTATSPITITALPIATFSYANDPYCKTGTDPIPTLATGAVAGTFTARPVGLSINATTGAVDLSVSTAGTYTVTNTVVAANGCPEVKATTNITINAPAVATFNYPDNPYCSNGTDPTPTFTGGGVAGTFTATPTGLVINATTGAVDLSASTAGTYTVTNTIVATGGCPIVTATSPITITALPIATFSYANTAYCKTGTDPSPTLATGAVAGTFTSTTGLAIDAGTGVVDLSASTAGTYTVTNTVVAANGCPEVKATTNITINAPAVATFNYPDNPYCSNGTDPTPTFTGGGVAGTFTATPTGLVINATTGAVDLSASTAGTYTVTNTIAATGGCPIVTATSPITITALPIATFSYANTPYCKTGTDPSPTLATGAVAGTFTSTTGLAINATTGVVDLSASTAGTYTVTNTVVAANGCPEVKATTNITINAPAVATFNYPDNPYCSNGTDPTPTFTGGGVAGTFTAKPTGLVINATTGVVDLSASTAGTYAVTNTIAASGGCPVISATSQIVITALPIATFSYANTAYCKTGTDPSPTLATGAVAGTFTSTTGLAIDAGTGVVDLSASTAGTYTVTNTVVAANGCPEVKATTNITINAPAVATFNYPDNPYCSNGTDPNPTFTGGGVAGTFTATPAGLVINPATGTVDLSASTAGTYTVTNTIAASGGCPVISATSQIVITALPIATFSYANDPYCKTGTDPSPTLATGAVAGTFTSTTGLAINATTGLVDLSASTAGTYTVTNTVVAANGCPEVKATTNITINAPAVATFNYPDNPYCSNGTDPTPTFTGGGVAGTFTATPTGLVINATTGAVDLSASTAGTYTVTNTIAASGGCPIVTATSSITITALPIATFSYANTPYCKTGTDPSPTLATGAVAGTFTARPVGLSINATTGAVDLSVSTAGTYTVTNTVAASAGCPRVTATTTITISTPAVATFNYPDNPYCSNGTDPTPTFTGGGVAGTFTAKPTGLVINATTGVVDLSASTAGTYTVTNTIAASGGCPVISATSQIVITALPIATFSYANTAYCKTGTDPSPTLATGAVAGTFTARPVGLSINATTGAVDLSVSTAGTYTVTNTVAASAGCPRVTATTTITISTPAVATFNYPDNPYCSNGTDPTPTFTGGGVAGTFTAKPTGLVINATTGAVDLSASTAGTYTVTNTIAATGGCPIVTATSPITILPIATATISGNTTICSQESSTFSITLTGTGPWDVVYNDGTTNTTINGIATSPHTVTVGPLRTTTTYRLVSVSDATCGAGTVSGTAIVNVTPILGDPTVYGDETWIGYVYDDTKDIRPYPTKVDFDISKYKGFIDHTDIPTSGRRSYYHIPSDTFHLNPEKNPLVGRNLCKSYTDNFSIRFRMRKTFAEGIYTFRIGADDGVKFYVDGTERLNDPTSFTTHRYTTYTTVPICLNGKHELVIEYFDARLHSSISFDYKTASVSITQTPRILCPGSTAIFQASTQNAGNNTTYQWQIDGVNVARETTSNFATDALTDGQKVRVLMKVTGSNCTIPSNEITVSVGNTPKPTGDAIQSFCTNNNPTVADLTAVGNDIKWYENAVGGQALAGNTPLIPNKKYYASQTIGGCGESSTRLEVTVRIFTATPPPTGDPNQSFCSPPNPTVADLNANGTDIKWYENPNGGNALAGGTPLTRNKKYYATQTVAGCGESATRLEVTVTFRIGTPRPTGPHNQSFCTNDNPTVADLDATGTNIKWYLQRDGGAILPPNTVLINNRRYFASQTDAPCGESRRRLSVLVTLFSDTPAPTGNANQSFCAGNSPTINDLVAVGNNVKWYATLIGGTPLAGTTPLVGNSTFYATQSVGGCGESKTRFAVNVTVSPNTPAPTGNKAQSFCAASNPTVGNLVATGTAIKWYDNPNGGVTLANGTALQNKKYYASQTAGRCGESSTRLEVTVTIFNATPVPTGDATQAFCSATNPTISDLIATGNNIKWYENPNGGTEIVAGTALINNKKYYATQTVAGCGESTTRLVVTVTLYNNTPAPTGDATQSFCAANIPKVSDLSATGTAIKWYETPNGGTEIVAGTVLVNNKKYYASQTVAGCGESANRLEVTVKLLRFAPSPTGDADQAFCANPTPTVASLRATGTDIKWYANATGGLALAPTVVLENGKTYYASQTSVGCGESTNRFAVTVTLLNNTLPPTGATTQSFCSNANPTIASLIVNGTNIKWYANATGGTALATTEVLQNGNTYYASQTSVVCGESTARLAVTVTLFNNTPAPTGDTAQSFCANPTPTVARLRATGTAIKWYANANGGTPLATTDIIENGKTYYASQTSADCGESTDRLAVAVTLFTDTPAPTGDPTQTFCDTPQPTVANLTATGNDIKWYSTPNGGTPLAGTTQLVANTDYYATQTVAGCGESTTRLKVTVKLTTGTPTVPTGITTSNVTCVSFQIAWQAVTDAKSYRLYVATDANFNTILPNYNDLEVKGTNTIVTGLTRGTQYFFRLRAVNDCGTSANSTTGNVTTSNTGCGGGNNCGAFTSIIEKQGATKLPTCADPESGSITYQITGGSGLYEVQLRDITDVNYTRFGQNRGGEVTVNALKAATYFVIVKDVNTGAICDGSKTNPTRRVTIGIATTVKADTVKGSINHVVCHGNKTGSVKLKDLSGSTTGNYFYSINGGAWVQLQIDRVPNFGDPNGLIPGTNAIRIGEKADDPCPQLLTVVLNPSNPAIVANGFSITAASCGGKDGKVKIEAGNITGGSSKFTDFEFNGKKYKELPIEENTLAAGTYPLKVTDDAGCTTSIDIKVPGGTEINPSVTPMDATCDSPSGASGSLFISFAGSTTDLLKIVGGVKYTVTLKEKGKEIAKHEFDLKKGTHLPASHTFPNLGAGTYTIEITTDDDACGKSETHTISGTTAISFNHQILCLGNDKKSLRLYNIKGENGKPYRLKYIDRKTNAVMVMAKLINLAPGTDEITITGEAFLATTKEYILRLEQAQTGCVAPQAIYSDSKDGLLILSKSITAAIKGVTKSLPDRPTGTITIHKIIGGFKPKKTPQPYSIRATLRVPIKPGQEYRTDFEKVELNPNTLGFEKTFTNAPAGNYLIEIIDLLGCGVSFDVDVPLNTDIFIPNVFTPNGDNENETFFVRNLPEKGNTKLIISNRWGKQVYSSDNYDNSWDGGEEKEGVYFYTLAIPNDKVYTGWVEIIRGSR